jgi:choline dehydrogenase
MIHDNAFAKLPYLVNILQAHTKSRLFLGAAASAVALAIILKQLIVKQPKLITDYAKVARELTDNGFEFDEWDFIIVGGGTTFIVLQLEHLRDQISSRHSRMCSGITSL